MKKLAIELPLLLPEGAGEADPCVDRLMELLAGRPGVQRVHVAREEHTPPELCIHFDPDVLPLARVETIVREAGADLGRRFGHVREEVRGLRHERHARVVEAAIAKAPGVLFVSASFGGQQVLVEIDPKVTSREAVRDAIRAAGIRIVTERGAEPARGDEAHDHAHAHGGEAHDHGHGEKGEGHDHEHGGPFGDKSELIFSLTCGALTLAGFVVEEVGLGAGGARALFVAAYLFGGYFTVQEAWTAIRGRRFEIDFLMLVAAAGAAALGKWMEGAMLLFLFTLGHALEGFAMARARNAIQALSKIAPKTALSLLPGGVEVEVPVESLRIGDRIVVKPNTRMPADGVIEAGASSVNQAPITGESVPVDKEPAPDLLAARRDPTKVAAKHRVFAGTINGGSALIVVVTKLAADSTLARVVKMVTEAETQKSRTQKLTDRFERLFVPAVIGLVVLLCFAWVVRPEPFSASFYRAMAVLVAASPCALAIATPSAVLAGVARAARGGVLIKGGAHLESLGSVGVIAFDKTGTLTEGKPRLTDVIPAEGIEEPRLLAAALAVERRSDHPLARAIVEGVAPRIPDPADAQEVEAVIGHGVRGKVGEHLVRLGKPALFTRDGVSLPASVEEAVRRLQESGRTVMICGEDDRILGVLGVMDTPREGVREIMAELAALGVRRTVMLTGDNQRVADAVAKSVGITEARGNLLPEDKVAAITELGGSGGGVAMVGDGVNDAPAMANATVGIAMGAGGSDVALETADVALMADNLRSLAFAVGLSRSSRRVVSQNLWASLGMVAFLVPATIFGLRIGAAVALHEGSTLIVVINALRLLAYQHRRTGAAS